MRHIQVQGSRSPFDGDWVYWSSRMGKHPEWHYGDRSDTNKPRSCNRSRSFGSLKCHHNTEILSA
ncbi:hypothetical protein H6G18_24150 [Anabaena subtropica FACHB-260]|uniref:Uncharacterized protein n=1 Tax=Anabaena subtropica FACHB-260 TaxID=2692884 RepID=A0ABR8CVH7_9NOST|nr:hypothetical protein [Anabaena subtropica FACHB-260]